MSLVRGLFLAFALQTADSFPFKLPSSCENISIPLCQRVLPYNLTRLPNLVGHRSQVLANREIQRYGQHVNCSRHAVFFLCSFYLPICIPGIDETEEPAKKRVIKPCRSLCEQVRNDCAPQMKSDWPKFVKCEEFPEFSGGVCIKPDSFISASKPSPNIDHEECQEASPADYKLYSSRQFDYVVKFKVILIERLENKGTIIRGRVGRVFKQHNVTISKGQHVNIWSNTNSTCPSLWSGKVFLIGGYEDPLREKLLLSSTSLIEVWSDQALKKIRRWQRLEKNRKRKEGKSSKVSNS